MKYVVVGDFSNLYHMAHSVALNAPPQYDVHETTVVNFEGKLRTLRRELTKLQILDYELILAEDRRPERKLALYPPYRGDRADSSGDKARLKTVMQERGLAARFCHSVGNEADDIAATLARLARRSPDIFCVLVSMDKDWWQVIGPRVVVYNPIARAMVQAEDIWKCFQVRPEQIPIYKALWGDAGDCVPNAVPRMQKQLLPIVRETVLGNWEDFKSRVISGWSGLSPRCRELYTEGLPVADRNYQLVKLDEYCPLTWG